MAGKKDQEFTLIIPGITKKEGKAIRDALVREKKKIAPQAKASIFVGKKENFCRLMRRTKHALKGD